MSTPGVAPEEARDRLRSMYEPRLQGLRDAWSEAIVKGDPALANQLNERYQRLQAEYREKLAKIR